MHRTTSRMAPAFILLTILALALTACGGGAASSSAVAAPKTTTTAPAQPAGAGLAQLTRSNSQGAVTIDITPLNLDRPGATLDFEVELNTHSVDLSYDLSKHAVFRSRGKEVAATQWSGGSGGHHVSGRLSFPATTADGAALLEPGTTPFEIVIRDVADVPERTFRWESGK